MNETWFPSSISEQKLCNQSIGRKMGMVPSSRARGPSAAGQKTKQAWCLLFLVGHFSGHAWGSVGDQPSHSPMQWNFPPLARRLPSRSSRPRSRPQLGFGGTMMPIPLQYVILICRVFPPLATLASPHRCPQQAQEGGSHSPPPWLPPGWRHPSSPPRRSRPSFGGTDSIPRPKGVCRPGLKHYFRNSERHL